MGGPSRDRRGQKAILEGWEWSGGPPGGTGGFGRVWEAHPDGRVVWKPSQQGREELGVPTGAGKGREADQEGSKGMGAIP